MVIRQKRSERGVGIENIVVRMSEHGFAKAIKKMSGYDKERKVLVAALSGGSSEAWALLMSVWIKSTQNMNWCSRK
jgi:hypothetical protein